MSTRRQLSVNDYVDGVLNFDLTVFARAVTLIESNRREHIEMAQEVLNAILPHTGKAIRVGITGVPGVGKSTFIESLGNQLIDEGNRLAVLAVDPSSSVKGGSILGDKTRMESLSRRPEAFIRPSPTRGALGGVHRKTRESMLLCEAAGFDVVLVETVGVGQSETAVARMVDTFLVLMLAGAGDELQGIKKGILEVADVLAINKADGDNVDRADKARRNYKNAIHLFAAGNDWVPPVVTCSGLKSDGVDGVWQRVMSHREYLTDSGELAKKRESQRVDWLRSLLEQELVSRFKSEKAAEFAAAEEAVRNGELTPTAAVVQLLNS